MENNCVFCNRSLDKGETIYETGNFFVNSGLGVAAPGHVMLICKCHCDCYANMPIELREEFKILKGMVCRKVHEAFGPLFMVEYGVLEQSVPHAHLHFIPKERPATEYYPAYRIDNVFELIAAPPGLGVAASWAAAENMRQKFGGYIYLEDGAARLFAEFPENYSSKNLSYRRFFNDRLGLADIPRTWKEITKKDLEIDRIKKEITGKHLKF